MLKRMIVLALVANVLSAPGAYAQTSATPATMSLAEKKEKAQFLFDWAVRDADEKNFDKACPRLEAALDLLPNHLRTAIALAQCYENWGHFLTARDKYEQALTVAANQPKQDIKKLNLITEGLASATRRISYVIVYVPGAVGSIDGVTVTLDLVALDRSDWGGTYTPLNQGKHVVRATAPGRKEWRQIIDVAGEGQRFEVSIERMEVDPKPEVQIEKTVPPLPQTPPLPSTSIPPKELEKPAAVESPAPAVKDPKTNQQLIHPREKPRHTKTTATNSSAVGGGIVLMFLGGGFITGGALMANKANSLNSGDEQIPVFTGLGGFGLVTGAVVMIAGLAVATGSPAKPENKAPVKRLPPTAALRVGPGQIFIEGTW